MKVDAEEQPLSVAEVFRGVTDGIWTELPIAPPMEDHSVASSVIRRNLQRDHVKKLSKLVLGQKERDDWLMLFIGNGGASVPPDARSLARLHMREISKRIGATLTDKQAGVDEATRAHLDECQERIAKVLSASIQVND